MYLIIVLFIFPPNFVLNLYNCSDPAILNFRCHPKDITSVAFHRSYPLFASCSDDCTAYVFHGMVYSDLNQNPLIVPLEILRGHTSANGRGECFDCLYFVFLLVMCGIQFSGDLNWMIVFLLKRIDREQRNEEIQSQVPCIILLLPRDFASQLCSQNIQPII